MSDFTDQLERDLDAVLSTDEHAVTVELDGVRVPVLKIESDETSDDYYSEDLSHPGLNVSEFTLRIKASSIARPKPDQEMVLNGIPCTVKKCEGERLLRLVLKRNES